MSTIEQTLLRLQKSAFRTKFHLSEKDRQYIMGKGMETIQHHAADFIRMRLAPAIIPNDGKQTPMRGHPVFIAQHACACCCRSCLLPLVPLYILAVFSHGGHAQRQFQRILYFRDSG